MVIQMEINIKDLLDVKIQDEVVVFQTDTVYGIGALLSSEKGVKKIYQVKSREAQKPLAVLCANIGQVKTLVKDFKTVEKHAIKHWPGALTLVLKKTDLVGDYITSGFDTVGVRIPKDEIALQILEKFGPMAVTSLNISSEPAILKYSDALRFNNEVDYIVKGKDLNSISSTVYDCVNKRVLRQGDISL
jgi:L-threonylcarbamoyladenylate synthase